CTTLLPHTAPTRAHTYTLSLHDALPISCGPVVDQPLLLLEPADPRARAVTVPDAPARSYLAAASGDGRACRPTPPNDADPDGTRSEDHTSELQSRFELVCRLLLEKKKYT